MSRRKTDAAAERRMETIPLAALRPPERNVRQHPEAQIVELMRAVEMFGQTRPVVIDEENTVLAGNGLVVALQRLERSEAQALRITGLSKAAKAKLMLSDNKIFSLGLDDYDGMMTLIRDLGDFDIPGFDADVLSSLLTSDEVAQAGFGEFGRMSEAEKANRESRPLASLQRVDGKTTVICPHCGKDFLVS